MSRDTFEELENMPKFRVGEIVIVNGVSFRINQISGSYLGLLCVQSEADKWQAFGQGIVEQLSENGLLPPTQP